MTPIELLQQVGLNKYEAEAYYALLREGPLTGYELGKRSAVPLSRSYEVLERLVGKGLALVEPGDPPRYAAEASDRFLAHTRRSLVGTLDALAAALAAHPRGRAGDEFWVIRGHANILAKLTASCDEARTGIAITLPTPEPPALHAALEAARGRGCLVTCFTASTPADEGLIALLVDDREALVGTLTSDDRSRAVVSSGPSLVRVLSVYFAAHDQSATGTTPASSPADPGARLAWVDWEARKQRALWRITTDNVA